MIDPRRYDDTERLAMTRIGQWGAISTFRPNFFQSGGFPVRISEIGEIRYMLTSLHSEQDSDRILREMRGLRSNDVDIIAGAIRRFLRFHVLFANRSVVQVPYTGFLYYYALMKKISRFPANRAVLDIGPGLGLMPFLFGNHFALETYNQVEVTQSLYVLQSAINSVVFADRYRDLAMEWSGPDLLTATELPWTSDVAECIEIALPDRVLCSSFPWWRTQEAFAQSYDIIMSNENICEMDPRAFAYFCDRARHALTPNGVLFIHGIGKTVGDRPRVIRDRLDILADRGFRPILTETSFENGGPLARPNLILVGQRHERYADAGQDMEVRLFDTADPQVRAIYGLDEPDGEVATLKRLRAELTRRLAGTAEPGTAQPAAAGAPA